VERRGNASIIHTPRELDLVSRDSFTQILSTATRGNTDDLVIDLGGCGYVDSTALNALVAMSNRGGRRLSVVIPPGNKCRRIFDLCGLGDVLNVTTSVDEALAKANS
jgi:anti-anti-sigma factor